MESEKNSNHFTPFFTERLTKYLTEILNGVDSTAFLEFISLHFFTLPIGVILTLLVELHSPPEINSDNKVHTVRVRCPSIISFIHFALQSFTHTYP